MLRPARARFDAATLRVAPTWRLAYGSGGAETDAVWQDEKFSVFAARPSELVLSPSGRFVVVGDAWLSSFAGLAPVPQEAQGKASLHPAHLHWIAATWERRGVETFEKLVGQFCLALWDRERQRLWLGRDRIGGKTLYYTTGSGTCWIAPRLRSLNPYHHRDLDPVALRDYLCCAFVPGSRTMWQQVREVRPGEYLEFPGGSRYVYGQVQEKVMEPGRSLQDCATELREQLKIVVQEHLPQNEAAGVFLSGGLDSSCVAAIASQFHSHPLHTYSIHFGKDCPNELAFSSLVAKHCHTAHHILEITFEQMWKRLPETMAQLDDPIGDPLTVPNLLLGQLASQSVGTILNGEGGDPCFGGPKNQPMLLSQLYGGLGAGPSTGPSAGPRSSPNAQDSLRAYLQSFQKCADSLPQLLKPEFWKQVEREESVFAEDLASDANYLNRLMALNIKFKGADHILTKVNNLTQAAGVAGRSPLFDQRIVQLSMAIPPEHKLSGVQEKAVLKAAVADLLPRQIVDRPKSGMMVPVQLGFRQHWQKQARRLLLSRRAAIAPYLNQALIRQWLDYKGDTWQRYGTKLWLLTSLELWLQLNSP